jgi:hypothetical protein
LKTFLPAELRSQDYPNLIPAGQTVPTVAVGVVLAAYAWPENSERYNRVAKFVNAFFDNLEKLKNPNRHPKWATINLAAEVNGWTRFKPAQQWLDGKRREFNDQPAVSTVDNELFRRVLADHRKKAGIPASKEASEADIAQLKQLFDKWLAEKASPDTGAASQQSKSGSR